MNSYFQSNLSKDDEIILVGTQAKKAAKLFLFLWLFSLIVAIVLCVVMFSTDLSNDGKTADYLLRAELFFAPASFLFFALFIGMLVRYLTGKFAFSKNKYFGKHGLINVFSYDIPLEKIDSVTVNKSLFGRIVNSGTLVVNTASTVYTIATCDNPEIFKNALIEQIDAKKKQVAEENAQKEAKMFAEAMSKEKEKH